MLPSVVARRAAQIRDLLSRGAFAGAKVPLRNGGRLPAELFAEVALGDLDRLSALNHQDDGEVSGVSWRRLAADIELLHDVARARDYASTGPDRVHA